VRVLRFAARARPATRLRILEINKFYAPHIGGIERVVQDLAEGFASAGHRVRVLACSTGKASRRVRRMNGVVVVYARSFGTFLSMPLSLDFMRLAVRMSKWADVVHWHEPFPLATLASLLVARLKTKVVTWHSDIVRQRTLKPLAAILQRLAIGRARIVVPTSEALLAHSPVLSRTTAACRCIPIGIEIDRGTSGDAEADRNWCASSLPFKRYGLFVGRLAYYKGLDVLLDALERRPIPTVIVGNGGLQKWIAGELEARGMMPYVRLVSRTISDSELHFFYKHCDFLVLPSIARAEAFGIVQVEAMMHGKPVVNTQLPTGVPAVSLDGVTGFTVPPGDAEALAEAMNRLWHDHRLRERLGAAARSRARRVFDRDVMINGYLSTFETAHRVS
jgi:rhamnosyl/mannosyltransferase